jgi:hypothetical protein
MSKDHNHGEPMTTRVEGVALSALPEFLPVNDYRFVRVSEVTVVERHSASIGLLGAYQAGVHAPYFAAWLDRLGIPWTEELRRAHDMWDSMQTKSDPCQDAPGGGMICTLSRGHALPHRGLWNGEIVRWNPPTHPDARGEEGS